MTNIELGFILLCTGVGSFIIGNMVFGLIKAEKVRRKLGDETYEWLAK